MQRDGSFNIKFVHGNNSFATACFILTAHNDRRISSDLKSAAFNSSNDLLDNRFGHFISFLLGCKIITLVSFVLTSA